MIAPKPRFGFRVIGSATNRRRLVDAGAALAAYADCAAKAEVNREAYLSAFTYADDFRQHIEETGSSKGYDGSCWAPFIWFDIDRAGDLGRALGDARRLAAGILHRYQAALDDDDLVLFFSGSKGFHAGLPTFWNPAPSLTFHRAARRFAEALAAAAGVSIDTGVYDKVRLFRAPNSRHPVTGLYKRRLTLEELLHLDAAGVQRLAAAPDSFALPVVTATDPQAAADWQAALQAVEREAEVKADRRATVAGGLPRLNRATLDFIRDGADEGDRHRKLFSAAANLAEFGCPDVLAHALLSDAALDCGLKPAEVRRQIDCGLRHAGTVPLEGFSTQQTSSTASSGSAPASVQQQLAALWSVPSDAGDAWESDLEHQGVDRLAFPFGANVPEPPRAEGGGS